MRTRRRLAAESTWRTEDDPMTNPDQLESMGCLTTMADLNRWAREIGYVSASKLARAYKVPVDKLLGYWVLSSEPWTFDPETAKTHMIGEDDILFVADNGNLYISRGDVAVTLLVNPADARQAYASGPVIDWLRP